jgi:hypothetical protein
MYITSHRVLQIRLAGNFLSHGSNHGKDALNQLLLRQHLNESPTWCTLLSLRLITKIPLLVV